jgi:diacylglycerol kinase family enzyme
MKALKSTKPARYRLNLDGKVEETSGLNCLVDNAGNMGVSGFNMIPGISVSDGLLDVILIENPSFSGLVGRSVRAAKTSTAPKEYRHWQAREIEIEADPPQLVQVDGEIIGQTPLAIHVVPGAVGVLTPKA